MKVVEPQVFLLAEPSFDEQGVEAFLAAIGAEGWQFPQVPEARILREDADMLVELAGRTCYKSFGTELNANITRVRENPAEYLANVIRSGHGSVLEHAQYTFGFHDVSRVFTHELVRHRVGVGISQESLRYVRLTELRGFIPPELEPIKDRVIAIFETLEEFQVAAAQELKLDEMGFSEKKKVTSALRRAAPIGLATTIVWSANVRTLRHVIEQRSSRHAEVEIRRVFAEVGRIMYERCNLLFGDAVAEEVDGITEWRFETSKV